MKVSYGRKATSEKAQFKNKEMFCEIKRKLFFFNSYLWALNHK